METKELATKDLEFSKIRERLTTVLDENKSACVKINGRLEITRPVALALLNQLARDIAMIGGSVSIKKLAKETGVRISEVSKKVIGKKINSIGELLKITSQEAEKIIAEYQKLIED